MKRKTLAVLGSALAAASLGAFTMFDREPSSPAPTAAAGTAPPAAAAPKPTMTMDEWLERRASGDPDLPSMPPHVETVVTSFGLPGELWERYETESVESLDKRIAELKTEFATLQQETAKLKEEHSKLARSSEPKRADELMRAKVLPMFEQRDRLLGETLLVVNAKALATDGAPVMPSEIFVR